MQDQYQGILEKYKYLLSLDTNWTELVKQLPSIGPNTFELLSKLDKSNEDFD